MQFITERSVLRGDLIAIEDIRQYTVVIRDGDGLRYINPEDDIAKGELYFVNQVFPIGNDELIIEKGRHVRVSKVSLMFGLVGLLG